MALLLSILFGDDSDRGGRERCFDSIAVVLSGGGETLVGTASAGIRPGLDRSLFNDREFGGYGPDSCTAGTTRRDGRDSAHSICAECVVDLDILCVEKRRSRVRGHFCAWALDHCFDCFVLAT